MGAAKTGVLVITMITLRTKDNAFFFMLFILL
jgi:hypothetical protein